MHTTDSAWKKKLPYLLIAPTVILILCFMVYPIMNVFTMSLQNFNLSSPFYNGFVGLDNFRKIFTEDALFFSSLLVSVKWVLIEVCSQLILGMVIALLINEKFKGRGLVRAAVLAPWAVSGVLTSMMWSLMFNEHIGVINALLQKLDLTSHNIAWIANTKTVFGAVVVAELWRGIPFFAILILAGLQNIPVELYESGAVDGARWRDSFLNITLPYLKDTIILSTLLRSVWEFNSVDLIYTMTGGGPANLTTTLSMYIAGQAVSAGNYGYGSALVVVSFLLLLGFALLYLEVSRFSQEE
jgi:multiple sugar transport system permease protein